MKDKLKEPAEEEVHYEKCYICASRKNLEEIEIDDDIHKVCLECRKMLGVTISTPKVIRQDDPDNS